MYTYENVVPTTDPYATGILAGLGVLILIFAVIAIAAGVLTIVGQWKVLKKAGKGGWESLVPVYNIYSLCEVIGLNPWWSLVVVGASIILPAIPLIGPLVSTALVIYFNVIFYLSISRSYGKSDAFALGLWFLAPIFWILLGSKDVEYLGPKPIDPLYKAVFEKNKTQASSPKETVSENDVKFCTQCGAKIETDVKYCPSCGKEITK